MFSARFNRASTLGAYLRRRRGLELFLLLGAVGLGLSAAVMWHIARNRPAPLIDPVTQLRGSTADLPADGRHQEENSLQEDENRQMHHPRFDFDHWLAEFESALAENPRQLELSRAPVTGPFSLVRIEYLRRELFDIYEHVPREATPTDVFVWSVGEPEQPYLTKLGGAPYRPKSWPWPTGEDGRALAFLGQVCFLDSRDLFKGDLPGDVLLIFTIDHEPVGDHHTEWVTYPLREPRWELEDCPPPDYNVPRVYGNIYRTVDYGDLYARRWEMHDLDPRFRSALFVYKAAKIGGIAASESSRDDLLGRRILCSIAHVNLSPREPLFVNLETVDDVWGEEGEQYELVIPDWGSLQFLLGEDGKVSVEWVVN